MQGFCMVLYLNDTKSLKNSVYHPLQNLKETWRKDREIRASSNSFSLTELEESIPVGFPEKSCMLLNAKFT